MAKTNTNPEVRFAGFTEDWEERELSKILNERKVMQKITEDAPILAFAAGQGVIDRSERKSNNRDHLTHDQENKIYKLTELNDIVYNPSNLKYGAIDRNKHGRGVISPIYVTFTTEEEPSFVELLVKSEKFKLRALQYEEGTVVKRQSVKPENLLSLKVNIATSKNEQKLVGNLFERIEKLISLHQSKYHKLSIIKQAMLDKMFPKHGQVVPEIRFKGFKGEWEEKRLRIISSIITKGTTPLDKSNFGEISFVKIENINAENGSINITSKISLEEHNGYLQRSQLQEGDILFSIAGTLGRVAIIPKQILPANTNQALAIIRLKDISVDYVATFLKGKGVKDFVRRNPTVGAQPNLSLEQVGNIEIPLPNYDEQKKIGTYFNNLDELIRNHNTQITKLQNIKKAFLAKMFI